VELVYLSSLVAMKFQIMEVEEVSSVLGLVVAIIIQKEE
jgi:hypothetical protein